MAQKFKPTTPLKTSATAAIPTQKATKTISNEPVEFIFDKGNYKFLIISVLIVAFGFILMSGTTDIYSSTKIVIAPIVVLAGFGLGFYAILKKPEVSK